MEGFAVLAAELLAMRLLVPFVGSGVEVVAIIISAVLLPLAAGYHVGGQRFYRAKQSSIRPLSIRFLLASNLGRASIVLTFGLSYVCLIAWFELMDGIGITHPLAQAAIYAAVFLVYPVFLLAQTVPLISNYFVHQHLSKITGKMLLFSTLGSFTGSVITTLVLMNTIGVHLSAVVALGMCVLAHTLLCKSWIRKVGLIFIWVMMIALNHPAAMRHAGVVSDNAYNTAMIKIDPDGNATQLWLNHSRSSIFSSDPTRRFEYIRAIETMVLEPLYGTEKPRDILVLGAGGFTLGWWDNTNRYVYVDIDRDLKTIAEKYVLPSTLPPNKHFEPKSARAYLQTHAQQFDVVIVDVYSNKESIPLETTTTEFWESVKSHLKPQGVVVANIIVSATFHDWFSTRIANTFSAVFPGHLRQVVNADFTVWDAPSKPRNVLFIYRDSKAAQRRESYDDDLSTFSLDRYRKD